MVTRNRANAVSLLVSHENALMIYRIDAWIDSLRCQFQSIRANDNKSKLTSVTVHPFVDNWKTNTWSRGRDSCTGHSWRRPIGARRRGGAWPGWAWPSRCELRPVERTKRRPAPPCGMYSAREWCRRMSRRDHRGRGKT